MNQRGQVLLVVVLLITVALTVGLSVATRSLVNVKMSAEEDQSQRAFSAAEAGIEQSLLTNTEISNFQLGNNTSYSTEIIGIGGTDFLLNNGKIVIKDEGADVWLSEYSPDQNRNYGNSWSGQVTIYWGTTSDVCDPVEGVNTMAAIELLVLEGNKNNPTMNKYAYDPCAARRSTNNFSSPGVGGNISGTSFAYSAQLSVTNGLLTRVIPLYANTIIGLRGGTSLPSQGTIISSTGSIGDVKRKVTVLRQNPVLPIEFFSYSFLWPK